MMYLALFAYDLRFWLSSLEDVADLLTTEDWM